MLVALQVQSGETDIEILANRDTIDTGTRGRDKTLGLLIVSPIQDKAARTRPDKMMLQVRVQYRPQKSLYEDVGRFFPSLRFEHRGKLNQLGIEIGSLALLTANIGSKPIPKFICHL